MQAYKVQHLLKQIQTLFHLREHIMTMLIIIIKEIRRNFNNIQSDDLKNVFKNSSIILAQKQPKNLLCYLKLDLILTLIILYNLRGCLNVQIDKHCKICWLNVNEGNSFVNPNNMRLELRSYVTCTDINVIYYSKYNMCQHKERYIGDTVGDDVAGVKSRINQHIIDCRTGTSTCKFPIRVYHCAMKNNFFQRTV